mgnify:CR=1 FL=1
MEHEAVAFDSITLKFDGKLLFENLTHSLAAGENLLITGANGSGKTSILRILAGELSASKGTHRISNFIYMPASPTNPQFRKVEEYFQLKGHAVARDSQFQKTVLARIQGKSMADLSSGEFKSAAIARVLSIDRSTYLLDEPTVTLDRSVIALLVEEIKRLNNLGCSFVIATNNIEDFREIDFQELFLSNDQPRPM